MTRVAAREGQFCTELRPAMPGRTMPRKHRPTPYETARLTIHLVKAFDEEHERKTTRFRLSQKTLRLIALRSSLRDVFIEEWRDELAGLAWAAFRIDDNFGLIERGTVNGWTRIGSARITDILRCLRQGTTKSSMKLHSKLSLTRLLRIKIRKTRPPSNRGRCNANGMQASRIRPTMEPVARSASGAYRPLPSV